MDMTWVNVKEELPVKKGRYLAALHSAVFIADYNGSELSPTWRRLDAGDQARLVNQAVTHWMLLPDPPN